MFESGNHGGESKGAFHFHWVKNANGAGNYISFHHCIYLPDLILFLYTCMLAGPRPYLVCYKQFFEKAREKPTNT